MNRSLLALEQNPAGAERAELLGEIFREAHSLKGAAGAAAFGEVEATAHKLENVFGAAKSGKITLTHEVCDVLYSSIDAVTAIIEASLQGEPHGLDLENLQARLDAVAEGRLAPPPEPARAAVSAVVSAASQEAERPAPAPAAQPAAPMIRAVEGETAGKAYKGEERRKSTSYGSAAEDTIRVATSKLDDLMTRSGELLVAGLKINQHLHEVEETVRSIEEWNREWLKARATHSALWHDSTREDVRPLARLLDANQERLRALAEQVSELQHGFTRDALHLSRVANDMGEGVMKIRMLPVSTVFDAFPRVVRDVARDRDKEVELVMEGGETELDRRVLEEIKDPLIHLLRNSVDHGIEKPDERIRAGKPRQGRATIKASQKGNNIIVQVGDDGAGIDRAKVKQAAVKAGLISEDEAHAMSDDEALRLIFASGLSTSPTVTGISGRGIGLDVVRKNVEALQGQVEVESVLGQGTVFSLTVPLTLATTQELLVQVGDQVHGIPISAVERIVRIEPKEIRSIGGQQAITVDSEPLALVRLSNILGGGESEQQGSASGKLPAVILTAGKKRIAFAVDAVVGQQDTVVKGFGKQLERVRNVAGATILGSGKVVMVLNPADLCKSARGEAKAAPLSRPKPTKAAEQHTVLVVDDSLSTRTLERNILETAGYKVITAIDGMEAMNVLSSDGGCDLIVSDVLMPRMNGFELTAAVKKDPKLKKTPVILVTSLDSRADKEHGIEVGADAYIVKSSFDQSNLLQTIAQLI
jgi:two-component system chemotaxis sensor kinase CheA